MRKAILYTGITVFLIALLLIIMSIEYSRESSRLENIEMRKAILMNQFIEMIDTDIPRASRIATIRSMLAIEDYCSRHAVFISNLSEVFKEAFMNGTVMGEEIPIIMNDSLGVYISRLKTTAHGMGMDLSINIENISLEQKSSWEIIISYILIVNITDNEDTYIAYEKPLNNTIEIIGLRDPLFSVYTNGRIHNEIKKTNHTPFVINGNASNFQEFAINMEYYENPDAPSFLDRFTGSLNPSPYGIEAMVNLEELAAQGLEIDTSKSIVDHLYFSNQSNTADWCSFEGLSSWIKIDETHGYFYGLDNVTHINCSG